MCATAFTCNCLAVHLIIAEGQRALEPCLHIVLITAIMSPICLDLHCALSTQIGGNGQPAALHDSCMYASMHALLCMHSQAHSCMRAPRVRTWQSEAGKAMALHTRSRHDVCLKHHAAAQSSPIHLQNGRHITRYSQLVALQSRANHCQPL